MPEDPVRQNAVLEAIVTRRSVGRLTGERPTRGQVELVISAAVHAPNHHHTHPWRFAVLSGDARARAGGILVASLERRATANGGAVPEGIRANEASKFLRAPVVIVAAVDPRPGEPLDEEVAAGSAAIQNMLLAAHSLGLGATWRTGEIVRDPSAAADFGFAATAVIIGFVYLGVPDPDAVPKPRPARPALEDVTRWAGWDD